MRFLRRIGAKLRPAVEEYDDPVFGPLRRVRGGDWCGEVPFHHPPTGATSLSLLIEAGEDHPTDEQRALFREIVPRYAELWPRVAEALAGYHPAHNTVGAVAEHIDEPCLCLDLVVVREPRRWSLQYTFDYPNEGDMGYFVHFCEWEIVGVSAAD
jgi:hypothetical protein